MNRLLVVYATRYGQARLIAGHIASAILARGLSVEVVECTHPPATASFDRCDGAVLIASVHFGKHERQMIEFVRHWRDDLNSLPTLFVSASLSEAGAEDPSAAPERRAQCAGDAKRMIVDFIMQAGWSPTEVLPVAGALAYTKYNWLLRLLMKRIAKRTGSPTDTSRAHEFTDWVALDNYFGEFLDAIQESKTQIRSHTLNSGQIHCPAREVIRRLVQLLH